MKAKTKRAARRNIHLLCNAHLDPVWLWEWQEGAAEAISTFRTAADLCEKNDTFIFNHNEVTLYKWIQEYEPELFRRIQKLVKKGRWHIMGGWYLQPDCNMTSGESFVRQILLGKAYFKKYFGVDVKTAINFDPFGHTRGLVQILAKSGYDSYLFGRPSPDDCPLPAEEFTWVGYDGSTVLATRFRGWYNSKLGGAAEKVTQWLADNPDGNVGLILWGVGNHGGGASKEDLRDVNRLIRSVKEANILHSTPEAYFKELGKSRDRLPAHRGDINPWGVGCYTSQVRVKQRMRLLENELYSVEKMAVAADSQGLMRYPREELADAQHDLLVGQFHDILPGSSIQPVEEASLRMLDHGLEILSRVKARAFFALSSGQKKAAGGRIPVMVYNPHPFPIKQLVEVEFNLPDFNHSGTFTQVRVEQGDKELPSQVEQELGNLPIDWRKRVVFLAELAPSRMNRFDCRLEVVRKKPAPRLRARGGKITFRTKDVTVVINTRTGLIDRYRARGVDFVGKNAFQPIVIKDDADSWGMLTQSYRRVEGRFRLMDRKGGARFSGIEDGTLDSVRVIEDGEARSVVEAVFAYRESFVCQRYKLPGHGTEIEIETRVFWNQKDRMLKLSVPVAVPGCKYLGQVAYGVGELPTDGKEAVAQKWVAAVDRRKNFALTCINDGVYGSDFSKDGLRLTLLRSPAYSCHPWENRIWLGKDRFIPRMDQGERFYRFWINGGKVAERLDHVDREALARGENPFVLSFFPPGGGVKPKSLVVLDDDVLEVTAVKKAEKGNDIIIRLFNPTSRTRSAMLSLPVLQRRIPIRLRGFEIKTLRAQPRSRKIREVNLVER